MNLYSPGIIEYVQEDINKLKKQVNDNETTSKDTINDICEHLKNLSCLLNSDMEKITKQEQILISGRCGVVVSIEACGNFKLQQASGRGSSPRSGPSNAVHHHF